MPNLPAGRTDSVDNVTDIIIETATEAADDLISQAFLRMNTALRGGVSFLTIGMLDQIIFDLSAQLQATLIDASIAGGISGAGEAAGSVQKAADALFTLPEPPRRPPRGIESLTGETPGLRFPVIDEAVKTLTEAPVFGGEDFRETADAVRRGAFAITTDATDETIREVRQILADGIARGDDTAAFVDNIEAAFDEGVGLSKSRWRMIFRNNVGQAVSNSQDAALEAPAVEDAFPYRRYIATHDIRVRPSHLSLEKAGLNNTAIYWKGDPVWEEFRPPWEWNDRCGWSPVTVLQAKEAGVREAIDWWERARKLSERFGGPVQSHLTETEPATHETVDHPPFSAPPEFRRETVV